MDPRRSAWIRESVSRYEEPLLRFALRITGDRERARDVVQDTFLRLCSQSRARIGNHVLPWLYKVCRNRALDVAKKEGRMSLMETGQLETRESPEPSPASLAERRDDERRVTQLIASLPDKQQEVLRLKFRNDLSYREISEITGLSVSNVGFLIHTGVQTLRRQLEPVRPATPGRRES